MNVLYAANFFSFSFAYHAKDIRALHVERVNGGRNVTYRRIVCRKCYSLQIIIHRTEFSLCYRCRGFTLETEHGNIHESVYLDVVQGHGLASIIHLAFN